MTHQKLQQEMNNIPPHLWRRYSSSDILQINVQHIGTRIHPAVYQVPYTSHTVDHMGHRCLNQTASLQLQQWMWRNNFLAYSQRTDRSPADVKVGIKLEVFSEDTPHTALW